MNSRLFRTHLVRFLLVASMLPCAVSVGQTISPNLYRGLRWRLVGPFRGGRAEAWQAPVGWRRSW